VAAITVPHWEQTRFALPLLARRCGWRWQALEQYQASRRTGRNAAPHSAVAVAGALPRW